MELTPFWLLVAASWSPEEVDALRAFAAELERLIPVADPRLRRQL